MTPRAVSVVTAVTVPQTEDHGHGEHAGHQVLGVLPAVGHGHGSAEQVHEHQHLEYGEQQAEPDLPGLTRPVGGVAPDHGHTVHGGQRARARRPRGLVQGRSVGQDHAFLAQVETARRWAVERGRPPVEAKSPDWTAAVETCQEETARCRWRISRTNPGMRRVSHCSGATQSSSRPSVRGRERGSPSQVAEKKVRC